MTPQERRNLRSAIADYSRAVSSKVGESIWGEIERIVEGYAESMALGRHDEILEARAEQARNETEEDCLIDHVRSIPPGKRLKFSTDRPNREIWVERITDGTYRIGGQTTWDATRVSRIIRNTLSKE